MTDLSDIVGQDAAVAQLVRLACGLGKGRSYIFSGPAGVGRRTTAEALAKVLLCERPTTVANAGRNAALSDEFAIPGACGVCAGCRTFDAGTNDGYILVSKSLGRFCSDAGVRRRVMQNLSIDVVREFIIEPANRHAAGGRGKVFVVRQAEQMSVAAQNALLKTLEEPPPGVSLILIAPSPEDLLPTIRSRCAVVRFGPLGRDFVAARLIADGVADKEAGFWATYTDGSLGESLRLAAGDLYATKCQLVDRLADSVDSVDSDLGQWLADLADSLADTAVAADKQLARTLATRQGAAVVLALLASIYRDVMAVAAGASSPRIHADQNDSIARLADSLGSDAAAEIVMQMGRYEQLLWRNVNPKTVWDNVMITCTTGLPLNV